MSLETYNPSQEPLEGNKKEKKLYPERAFSSVEESIKRLKKLETGEIKITELSAEERSEILSFENELGAELEEIFKIKVNSTVIYPEYLLTNQGKAFFRSCTGFDVEGEDLESIEKFLYRSRGKIESISGIQLKELEGQLKKYSEDVLVEKITAKMSDSGEIGITGLETFQPFTIVLNPEDALAKLQKLRNFKQSLKKVTTEDEGEFVTDNYKSALSAVLEQYRLRVNELIVDQFGHVACTKMLADKIGKENLSEEEANLLQQFSGLSEFVSVYSRFDKLVFGAAEDADEKGNYQQVGKKLEEYAVEMERKYIENERTKKQKATEKGLDFNKITKKNISKDIFAKYAEVFLERYNQKSSQPAENFDPKRKGPAPDGKWQFVISDGYNSMEVVGKQKIIKAPTRDGSVQDLISVMLGHEFTHFIQALNQSKIKLKLYDSVGGDRRLVLAEGAAMSAQKLISEEIFGFSVLPKPNYVKAMTAKLNGGTYLDCVKVYYECSLKIYLETTEKKDEALLKEKAKELIGVSIRSCKRLFRTGEQLNAKSSILSKSKDTVYLEQIVVMDRLKEAGLEKYALVKGLNLDSLFVLLKNGFIEKNEIEALDLNFVRKAWDEMREKFLLNNEEKN